MATSDHRLSTHSYQDPINCICCMSSKHTCHPLSKSSSNLLCTGQYATQSSKQELRKSLSSFVCQSRVPEKSLPCSHASLWSPVHNNTAVSSCGAQIPCSQLLVGNTPTGAKAMNNFLTVDRSTTSWDKNDVRIHVRSSTAENVSSVGEEEPMLGKTQSEDPLEEMRLMVQKSHSEFLYGCSEPSSAAHHKTSATYSGFFPSNNMYETAGRDLSFQSRMYELAHNQNSTNQTEFMTSTRDRNASPVSFCNEFMTSARDRNASPVSFCNEFMTSARDQNASPVSFCNEFMTSARDQNASPVSFSSDYMTSIRDQNSSPVSFATDAIQHDITIYTSPGRFQLGAIRPQDHGNAYPDNRIMNSQSTASLMCGTTCNNNSCAVHLTPAMTIHDSCAMHCHVRNEPCVKVSDTVAAYCHSLPIPAIQLAPRLACASVNQPGREQIAPGYCLPLPISDMVTFPKLACSISESGLDAKRLMQCGSIPGEQSPLLRRETIGTSSPETSRTNLSVNTSLPTFSMEMSAKTRDTWTMTAMDNRAMGLKPTYEYKDAEVQTVAFLETKSAATSPSPFGGSRTHVFPEVSLMLDLQGSPTPVREVRWDDEGMTWEVYGASVDPEVLGLAIQKHLEIQIEEHLKPAESPKNNTGVHSSKEEKRRSFRTIMYSLRRSSCCARSNAAVE